MHALTGKDGKVHVFRLTDFEGEANESIIRTKNECKEHKLDKTRGKANHYCKQTRQDYFCWVQGS